MPTRTGTAHVVTTTRKYKDQVYRTHLLRRSYREGGQVKNETLGNLSHLPESLIDIIRRSLRGETFVSLEQAFESCARPRMDMCRPSVTYGLLTDARGCPVAVSVYEGNAVHGRS